MEIDLPGAKYGVAEALGLAKSYNCGTRIDCVEFDIWRYIWSETLRNETA